MEVVFVEVLIRCIRDVGDKKGKHLGLGHL